MMCEALQRRGSDRSPDPGDRRCGQEAAPVRGVRREERFRRARPDVDHRHPAGHGRADQAAAAAGRDDRAVLSALPHAPHGFQEDRPVRVPVLLRHLRRRTGAAAEGHAPERAARGQGARPAKGVRVAHVGRSWRDCEQALDEAVADENFEEAARLRDQIRACRDRAGRGRRKATAMNVDDLMQPRQAPGWPDRRGPGIVVSSRVRLARNLQRRRLPRLGGRGGVRSASGSRRPRSPRPARPPSQPGLAVGMDGAGRPGPADPLRAPPDQPRAGREGRGQRAGRRGRTRALAVMVNEEDHLRMQAMRPGPGPRAAPGSRSTRWTREIESSVHVRLFPATRLPDRLPDATWAPGMRASVMLHLPGLVLMNEINPIIKGMGKIGLAVRGLWGEGTEATGNMFQISQPDHPGREARRRSSSNLEQIVSEDRRTREECPGAAAGEEARPWCKDHVGRAFGILSNAHILASKEALDLLSGLRLGHRFGYTERHGSAARSTSCCC